MYIVYRKERFEPGMLCFKLQISNWSYPSRRVLQWYDSSNTVLVQSYLRREKVFTLL